MRNGNRRLARSAIAATLGAGLLAFLPSPASASHEAARDIEDACPAGQVPDANFEDVPEGDPTDPTDVAAATDLAIDCIAAYDVTSGVGDLDGDGQPEFAPTGTVKRGQLATFIMQKLDLVEGFERPADAPNEFTDDNGDTHEENINDAAAAGIVQGFEEDINNDGQEPDFGPARDVTRAQMATFIIGQLEAAGAEIPAVPAEDPFEDVSRDEEDDDFTVHAENIAILHELGIFVGDAEGNYNPDAPISRAQMALVLARDIDVLVEQGLIEPLSGGNNQTFTITPNDDQTVLVTDDPADSSVQLSANVGDAESVDIALFNCEDVLRDGETITFADTDDDNEADNIGDGEGAITVVGGVAQADNTTEVSGVTPEDGEVNFSINANTTGDAGCVVAVVFEDDGDDDLDLDEDGNPVEDFAVSGEITFLPPEGENGANDTGTATFVDKDEDLFVIDDDTTYEYDANDNFNILGDPATAEEFEAALSEGDEVNVNPYASNPDLASTFNIVDDTPDAPTVDVQPEGSNDVTVEVTPTNPTYADMDPDDVIILVRAELDEDNGTGNEDECEVTDALFFLFGPDQVPGNADDPSRDELQAQYDVVDTQTVAEEAAADDDGTFVFELTDEPAGCFTYAAVAVVDGDIGDPGVDLANLAVDTTGTDDATAPLLIDADLDDGGAELSEIDAGDTISLQFNETMDPAAQTGTFRFTDAEGATFQIRCGVGGNLCQLVDGDANQDTDITDDNDVDSLLTVTVGVVEFVAGVNTTPGAQAPGTITEFSTQFNDASGNQVDLAASTDKVIDVEL